VRPLLCNVEGPYFFHMERKEYQRKANGKFMITGEYIVLRGAEALAVPLRFGQSVLLVPNDGEAVYWEGFEPKGKWFETAFHAETLKVLMGEDAAKSDRLVNIVTEIRKQNPDFLKNGWWVRTDLDFNPAFGMGSSSTLLSLLCDAAGTDAFPVLENTFGGSGYDLACAFAHQPIVYSIVGQKPKTESVSLSKNITDHILFVYSGNKMVSSGEVKKFSSLKIEDSVTESFTGLTRAAIAANDFETFADVMQAHERKMGEILEQPILQTRFTDFNGQLKSMGAWGGDFFMAVTDDLEKGKKYFEDKGFSPVYTYDEVVFRQPFFNPIN